MNNPLFEYTFDIEGTSSKLVVIKMCKNNEGLLKSIIGTNITVYEDGVAQFCSVDGTKWQNLVIDINPNTNVCWIVDCNGNRISPYFGTDAIFNKFDV